MKQLRIPPLLVDIVQNGLLACEDTVYDTRDACPVCRGKLSGYDTKKKQFAVVLDAGRRHPVQVVVKRFSCQHCHAICFADEPFYPYTRTGSPLVDLSLTLAAVMPFHRSAAVMEHLGILIDRGTIRNYTRRPFPKISATNLFGIQLPLSILSLSELAARSGEGGRIEGAEVLAACGFPSAYRATPDLPALPEQGNEREKKEDKKERQPDYP